MVASNRHLSHGSTKYDEWTSVPVEESGRYFEGPRNLNSHSKIPLFLRLQGSVLPRMIVPLLCIGLWASFVTYISLNYVSLAVEPLLLTVLGFVVGLCLSFRSSTAYERYSEGRKSWTTLLVQARILARLIWIHVPEKADTDTDPDCQKSDLLTKVTAINLIQAFAVSLKHQLRFEPYTYYDDLAPLVGHLESYAKMAQNSDSEKAARKLRKRSLFKKLGIFLSLSFATSNPAKAVKRANAPLGNLPIEILTYISAYVEEAVAKSPNISTVIYTQIMNTLVALTDVQGQTDRILHTPLPISYNILISQLVLLYTYLLPFQLHDKLGWVTVPATLAAAYIIIGIASIGNELENPFGNDVNDLPLDTYCHELRRDLEVLTSKKPCDFKDAVTDQGNLPFWPLSLQNYSMWYQRDEKSIRDVLRAKVYMRKP